MATLKDPIVSYWLLLLLLLPAIRVIQSYHYFCHSDIHYYSH